jgi:hypothetical protein
MIEEAAEFLTKKKNPVHMRAAKLFEFQCWIYGGRDRSAFSKAARAVGTLAILQEMRKNQKDDLEAVRSLLDWCIPEPPGQFFWHVCRYAVGSELPNRIDASRIAANVIEFARGFVREGHESRGGGGSTMARSIVRQTDPYLPFMSKSQAQEQWLAFSSSAIFIYLTKNGYGDFVPKYHMRSLGMSLMRLARQTDYIAEYFCAYNAVVRELQDYGYKYKEAPTREVPFQLPEPKPLPSSVVTAIKDYDPDKESSPDSGRVPRLRSRSI